MRSVPEFVDRRRRRVCLSHTISSTVEFRHSHTVPRHSTTFPVQCPLNSTLQLSLLNFKPLPLSISFRAAVAFMLSCLQELYRRRVPGPARAGTIRIDNDSKVTWVEIQRLSKVNAHLSTLHEDAREAHTTIVNAYMSLAQKQEQDGNSKSDQSSPAALLLYQGSEQGEDGESAVSSSETLSAVPNGFFSAVEQAYSTHGGLLLSPDDVWLAVQLQFCRYMEQNAEALRSMFVDHPGKMKLAVAMLRPDWPLFMNMVTDRIAAHTKQDMRADFLPEFSTTTPLQSSLRYLAIMDGMQHYFEYEMFSGCGIVKVGFLGSLTDWQALRTAVKGLAKYHLSTESRYFSSLRQWIADMVTIIDQFIATYTGSRVDVGWWNSVMQSAKAQGASGRMTNGISGWVLAFMVGDYTTPHRISAVPAHRFNVPVLVTETQDDRTLTYTTRAMGGFTGVLHNRDTHVYRPQCSLGVVKVAGTETDEQR